MVIVYYPPGQSVENGIEIINYLTDGLDSLLHVRLSTGIIIAGDFNKLNLSRLCNRFGLKKNSFLADTRKKYLRSDSHEYG